MKARSVQNPIPIALPKSSATKKIKKLLIWIYFFLPPLFFANITHAQDEQNTSYNLKHITDDNGLPQNTVRAIVKDKEGFIWLATENGMVRYDGIHFKSFNSSNLRIRSNRFKFFTPVFSNKQLGLNGFYGISGEGDAVYFKDGAAIVDSVNYKAIITKSVFSESLNNDKASIGTGLPATPDIQHFNNYIIFDTQGGYYVCTRKKITHYRGSDKLSETEFNAPEFWSFFRVRDSLYHIDTRLNITHIETGTTTSIKIIGDITDDIRLKARPDNINVLYNNATEQIFAAINNRLYILNKQDSATFNSRLILSGFNIKENNITSAFYDAEKKLLFLGSLNKGLFQFTPKQFGVYGRETNVYYYSQIEWKDNMVLTPSGRVISSQSTIRRLPLLKRIGAIDLEWIIKDSNQNIWVNNQNDLYKLNYGVDKILDHWSLSNHIDCIAEGRNNKIWIGLNKKGIICINGESKHAEADSFLFHSAIKQITCLYEFENKLLVGTSENLYTIDFADKKIDSIPGLVGKNIRSIYVKNKSEIWITTYSSGIFLLRADELVQFPTDKNKYLKTAHCILEDKAGYFWITTNKGMFKTTREDMLRYADGKQADIFYYYYSKDDGLTTNEFNGGCQPCGISLTNGEVSFPSFDGLVWFKPEEVIQMNPERNFFIENIKLNAVTIPLQDTIVLESDFESLQLFCTSPYFGRAENVQLRYSIQKNGETAKWIALPNGNTITVTSLKGGKYTLDIKKVNSFGTNNSTTKKILLIVKPEFYQTPLFYILIGISSIIIGILYSKFRFRYVERKNRLLNDKIEQRTSELQNTLTALSASQLKLKNQMHVKEILLTTISHDIGSPLKYMSMTAEKVKMDMETNAITNQTFSLLDNIYQSSYYVYHFSRNILNYIKITSQKENFKSIAFNLHEMVEEKSAVFNLIGKEKSVVVYNMVPEQTMVTSVKILLQVVVHNLIDNAIKACRNSPVNILCYKCNDYLTITIHDTGPGISKAIAEFYNAEGVSEEEENEFRLNYPGFGLAIVKELLQIIGAKLEVDSDDTGTKMHIILHNQ